jgi:hypothetical protein
MREARAVLYICPMERLFRPRVPGNKRGNRCPPHGPLLAEAFSKVGGYVIRCLKCGTTGPPGEDAMEAKRAFDECSAS